MALQSTDPTDPMLLAPAQAGVDRADLVIQYGDLHNLTFEQKKLLAYALEEPTMKAACASAGITIWQHRKWLRTNELYAEAFRRVGTGLLAEARAKLDTLVVKAADVFEEALDAKKLLKVECPHCTKEFSINIQDTKARIDVAKEVFRRSGDLGKVQVEHKVRDMATEDRIAVAQIARAVRLGEPIPVPPDVVQDLQRRGLLPDDLLQRIRRDGDTPTPPAGEHRALVPGP